jgi:serine/threonine-protein kinase
LAGRYTLESELGRGGMATVYLASDLRHDRLVALKVLAPEIAASLGADRFLREIRLTARLDHPHILPVLDSGEAGRRLWYTMPYVEGESLRDRLRRETQLSVQDAVRLAGEVADALAYAHRLGIVHRDIKPENILLSQGHARVADFGVAQVMESQAEQLTATGYAVGTPAYMAPEQAAGKADARSDLYSLASVLYEMLAGEPPFTGPSAQAILTKRSVGPVPSVRLTRPDVPAELDALVTRALSPVPAARHASASEFASDLGRSASGSTVIIPERGFRLRWLPLAVGGLALLAGGVVLARSYLRSSPRDEPSMVAVLPFENVGSPEDAAFADGLTLEITNRLAGISGVGVISRASAMQYKGTTKPRLQIGRELGVGYVLEGNVQWARQADSTVRIRVTPQLVAVEGDRQIWADRYDAEVRDIFEVQTRIAEKVSGALHGTLASARSDSAAEMPTASSEAYVLHLRGYGLLERHDPASIREAIALYEKALQLDPSFALAHFYLGVAHYNMWSSGADHTPARRALADQHLERAAQLGPDLPEIRSYQGWRAVEQGGYAEAHERFEWLRTHHPGREEGWWGLGLVLERQGRFSEAVVAHQRFIELDPRNSGGYNELANAAWMLRDYPLARGTVERGLAVAPDDIWLIARKAGILGTLGARPDSAAMVVEEALARLGVHRMGSELLAVSRFVSRGTATTLLSYPRDSFDLDPATYYSLKVELARTAAEVATARVYADSSRRILEPVIRSSAGNDPSLRLQLAFTYAGLGRHHDAIREAKRAAADKPLERDALEGAHYAATLAYMHALSGEVDSAVAQLERLLKVPSPISVPGLRADPRWRFIRDDPRFQRLLAS